MSDADTTEPAVNFEVDTEPAAPEEDSVVGEKPITDAEDVNEWRRRRRRDIPAVLRREAARRERPLPRACEERRRLRQAVAHRAGRATGRLADPTDLEFADDHLDDPDALAAAIDDLLARKPHLASRRPTNEIGQGDTPSTATVDLAAILRRRAQ